MGNRCTKMMNTAAGIARRAAGRRALLDPLAAQAHAEYEAGASLAALGRKYGRDRRGIRDLFTTRGLHVRPATNVPSTGRSRWGRWNPMVPFAADQLSALIARTTEMKLPRAIRHEWRKWSLEKRADFVRRLRARLASPKDQPTTPFSANVEPFDAGSPRAHAIVAALNVGRNSRTKAIQLRFGSQGVIWRGQLWFWNHKAGYQRGKWTREDGRPSLHNTIWSEHHGRRLPAGHVIRFIDGNHNNLVPENLALASRNDVCRENQAAALTRKSRETTAALLNRQQSPSSHATDLLHALH